MAMTLSNYSGAADTFTWPDNPNTVDDVLDSNYTITNIDYQRYHIFVSGGGIPPKSIILTGDFHGTTKNTSYLALSKHFSENYKLKKLYWETGKFYLGVGKQCKKTHTGGRTNFIDYVATFETVIGILFGNTQHDGTSGDAKTNAGNVTTFVEEITGTVTSGASDITVTDSIGNQLTIPNSALTTGQAIVIKFVKMVDSGDGIYVTEYNYCTIAGTQTKAISVTEGFGMTQIESSGDSDDITITNMSNWHIKFHDGWSA